MSFHTNFNLESIFTPVNADALERILKLTKYDEGETQFLVQGFRQGFDFHYHGPTNRCDFSPNLPLTVGTVYDLLNKIDEEVQAQRYAGPFDTMPFPHFMQSPVGLVPKSGGKLRLIFHLSYTFGGKGSFNEFIPEEMCTVQYNDFDYAIQTCLKWCHKNELCQKQIFLSKADVRSAFRIIPGHPRNWPWTVLKATHPCTKKTYYWVDKNLPFGSSISCNLFQHFSNAIKHIIEAFTGRPMSVTNFLDDFLYVAPARVECNHMVRTFIQFARQIGLTVAEEKTVWATHRLVFLRLLMVGDRFIVAIPDDKRDRALNLAKLLANKKKATIHELQQFTSFLNFLCKAIYPGQAFTRRMYAKIPWVSKNRKKLQQHQHVYLDMEFRQDYKVWIEFLELEQESQLSISRPFVDFVISLHATELDLYTDSSGKGFGGYFGRKWFAGCWGKNFMAKHKPSIQFLELYAISIAIHLWAKDLSNSRVVLFTDNKTAQDVLNSSSSSCKQCMKLIRSNVMTELKFNVRFFAQYVEGFKNNRADDLSRGKIKRFLKSNPQATTTGETLPGELYPVDRVWHR